MHMRIHGRARGRRLSGWVLSVRCSASGAASSNWRLEQRHEERRLELLGRGSVSWGVAGIGADGLTSRSRGGTRGEIGEKP
jgi:hypothetical protein